MKIRVKIQTIKTLVFLLMMIFATSLTAMAQEKVSGIVKDDTGETMPGVSIKVKGNNNVGAVTDIDGAFTINVKRGTVLQFSFLGYNTKEEKATPGKIMQIVLEEDKKTLGEIVVVGYQPVRQRDLTGSVAKADVSQLTNTPVSSIDQTLGGRIAGVNVSSGEGMPGGQMNITIRGNNSLTQANTPLYVIDGFPVENASVAASINPNDIKSLNILKDASASAIYGARGANGVVIITTKSGQTGKAKITYDGSYGWQTVSNKMEMMDAYEFVKLQNEMYPDAVATTYLKEYEGKQWTLDDYRNIAKYNWQDMIFHSAPIQSHNVSLTGGSQDIRYNASLSYFDQDGVVINSNYNRVQGRMGTNIKKNKLRINLNVNYSRTNQEGASPSQSASSGMNNLFYSVWGYRPVTQPGTPLSYLLNNGVDESVSTSTDYRFNPYMDLNNAYNHTLNTYVQFNGFLEYEIMKGMKLKVSGGYTDTGFNNDNFNNSKSRYGGPLSNDKVNARVTRSSRSTWLNENTLTYQTNIKKKHFFNTLLGFSLQNSDYDYYSFKTIHIPNESLGMAGMSQGTPTTTVSTKSSWSMISYFGRFNYNYYSKYYATFTMRADGSSKFRKGNRFGYFPSGSLAWNVAEEDFMKPLRMYIDNAKIRLSWGLTGNNRVGEYASYGLMDVQKSWNGQVTLGSIPSGVYPLNGNQSNVGMVPTTIPNKDLKWETTEQWNLGFDLSFLQERIGLTVDLYRKNTRDLLLNSNLPLSSGFVSAM